MAEKQKNKKQKERGGKMRTNVRVVGKRFVSAQLNVDIIIDSQFDDLCDDVIAAARGLSAGAAADRALKTGESFRDFVFLDSIQDKCNLPGPSGISINSSL